MRRARSASCPPTIPSQPLTLISRAQAEPRISCRCGAREIVDPHQRRSCELPPRGGRPGEPRSSGRRSSPGSDRVYLTGATAYRDHLAISSRVDGLDQLILRTYAGEETRIPFEEASYSAFFLGNPEFAPDAYRVGYSSMVTPTTVYDYHPASGALEVLKVQEIPSGYDASQYATERLMIDARDGVKVPVSVVYRKGFEKNGEGKLFLYAYGAYGMAIPPAFNSNRISLLDRGWACAIAHIRGGDDLGYKWFLDGKLDQADQHVQRFRRCREGAGRGEVHARRQDRDQRRIGRRRADGRGGQFRSRAVGRGGRRRALRRRAQHDARRHAAADARRMARMGQSDHRQGGVRPTSAATALRQREGAGLSAAADHRRPYRPARDLLGAGEVGRQAARDQDRRQSAAPQDQHGRRATAASRAGGRSCTRWRRPTASS